MDLSIIELSKYPNAHKILYEYNCDIGCTLDDEALNQWIEKIIKIGDPIAIVENEKIIAFLLLYCNNMDTLEAYICNVFVNGHHRGKKLSKLLVEKAQAICSQRNFRVINLDVAEDNIPARKIYAECGFVETRKYVKDSLIYIRMQYIL